MTEVYRRADDGSYLQLAKREQTSTGIVTRWPDVAFGALSDEKFRETTFETSSGYQTWSAAEDGNWSCEFGAYEGDELSTVSFEYYWNLVEVILRGTPTSEETILGRKVVGIEWSTGSGERTAYVDTKTFLPLGFSLPPIEGLESLGVTVTVTGINVDTMVVAPTGSCAGQASMDVTSSRS